ncbi:MAG TPA: flagellar hook-basal body complex protein [Tepidisphaeraceae bacterium]|jgi:flagellar hook protein FlgE
MALTSALFTGLSGLNVNQTRLNVVGNNIANANTVAFKSSRAMFAPQFYITDSAGGPPSSTFGGENPSQRGLGATVSAIQKDFSQGSLETTGKATDLAIDGNGMFIVEGQERMYTRDGSFTVNTDNQLVSQRGDYVMGFGADENGQVIKGPLTRLEVPTDIKSQAQATENATLQGNLNANGEVAAGASVLSSPALQLVGGGAVALTTALDDVSLDGTTQLFNSGSTPPDNLKLEGKKGGRSLAALEFEITPTSTVQDLLDFYNQGLQIKTDEPPVAGFAPGATLDTATGQIKITGNAGVDNAITLNGTSFSSGNPNMTLGFADDPTSNPAGESVSTSFEVYDSLGTPVTIDVTATLVAKTDTGTEWRFIASSPENTRADEFDPAGTGATAFYGAILSSGTLNFDSDGKLIGSTGNSVTLDRSGTGAVPSQNVELDFEGLTSLTTLDSALVMDNQDGFATGTLNGFNVGPNGVITGTFTNGQTKTLGQVAIAQFDNPEGLIDQGSNLYATGANSGTPTIGAPLELNGGAVRSGSLELSNVDLSREFINLIISSTGFTAASRVITTSDQLLTELLNTTR